MSSGLTKFLSLQKYSYPRLYKEPRSWSFLSSNWNCLFTASQSLHWFKCVYHYLKLLDLFYHWHIIFSLTKLEAFRGSYLFCLISFLSFRNTIDTKKMILNEIYHLYFTCCGRRPDFLDQKKKNIFLKYHIYICVYLLIWWITITILTALLKCR